MYIPYKTIIYKSDSSQCLRNTFIWHLLIFLSFPSASALCSLAPFRYLHLHSVHPLPSPHHHRPVPTPNAINTSTTTTTTTNSPSPQLPTPSRQHRTILTTISPSPTHQYSTTTIATITNLLLPDLAAPTPTPPNIDTQQVVTLFDHVASSLDVGNSVTDS